MCQLIEIWPFRPSDAQACCEIRRRAVLAVSPRFYGRAVRQAWTSEFSSNPDLDIVAAGGTVLIAKSSNDQARGFASFRLFGNIGKLLRLYIEPDVQELGIGSALLRKSEEQMAAAGADKAILEASLSALAFYERRGYQVTARIRHDLGNGIKMDVRDMEKSL
ncbi:MAG: N-acetyltransferase family protein [Paracoccaceae bacterium]